MSKFRVFNKKKLFFSLNKQETLESPRRKKVSRKTKKRLTDDNIKNPTHRKSEKYQEKKYVRNTRENFIHKPNVEMFQEAAF